MVWGCMSSKGVGLLNKVQGHVNAVKYREILQGGMLPSAAATFDAEEWTFQQDNAPSHKAKSVATWFERNNVDVLE